MEKYGFLFDMDGVVVDNHTFHFKAWQKFCDNHGVSIDEEFYKQKINGTPLKACLETIFQKEFSYKEAKELGEEKEETYRRLYRPFLSPVKGLVEFLESTEKEGHGIALATSGPKENVDFVLDELKIRSYFSSIIDSSGVTKGKPHPEIYLKSANNLKLASDRCVVFEDSLSGIKAGIGAGCKVIGLATTHNRQELPQSVDLKIDNFTQLTVSDCLNLLI